MAITTSTTRYQYLVLRSNLHFQSQILDATPDKPFLAFVLQIDPAVVRKVSAEMVGRRGVADHPTAPTESQDQSVVSELDDELMSAVLRFMRSLTADSDRRVLAPLYLQELVYRILQRDRFSKLLLIAGQQDDGNSVAAALNYINAHLSEPLTVEILAEQVNLSSSAFSRRFRELTGRSPYQFVKETRLERARELLLERRLGVGDISVAVGYASHVALHEGIPGAFRDHPARVRRRRRTEPRSACHSLTMESEWARVEQKWASTPPDARG